MEEEVAAQQVAEAEAEAVAAQQVAEAVAAAVEAAVEEGEEVRLVRVIQQKQLAT